MRVILNVDDAKDLDVCLMLAKESLKLNRMEFGHWSSGDPSFSAYVHKNKTGVTVTGRRDP